MDALCCCAASHRAGATSASAYRNWTQEDGAGAPRQMPLCSRTQYHKLYKMDGSEISCSDELHPLRRLVYHYSCCRLLGDESRSRACLLSTKCGQKHEVETHGLYRRIIQETDITTRAFWVHRSIAVVLHQCTCSDICPVADAACMGTQGCPALLGWDVWGRKIVRFMNLLLMLRRHTQCEERQKLRGKYLQE